MTKRIEMKPEKTREQGMRRLPKKEERLNQYATKRAALEHAKYRDRVSGNRYKHTVEKATCYRVKTNGDIDQYQCWTCIA